MYFSYYFIVVITEGYNEKGKKILDTSLILGTVTFGVSACGESDVAFEYAHIIGDFSCNPNHFLHRKRLCIMR